MPLTGLEPVRVAPLDFESSASANSATAAYNSINFNTNNVKSQDIFYTMPSTASAHFTPSTAADIIPPA